MNTLSSTIVESLKSKGESLSVAESITGGALTSEIVSVPGASHILKGSIVAYSVEIKMRELSVPQELIDRAGVVSEEVALGMADGIRARMNTTWSIASTGVAGPGPHQGIAAGTVWLAIVGPNTRETVKLALEGDRETVRRGAVESALGVFARILSA
ncbi:MAG: CinA family protein [Candidatus Nanopelagicaceae bacterium]|jgi:nicotinamide-nucleotide amidase|nr:CinA family protein [Candidatus Nanopelagicaceae bacterium]